MTALKYVHTTHPDHLDDIALERAYMAMELRRCQRELQCAQRAHRHALSHNGNVTETSATVKYWLRRCDELELALL